MSLSDREKAFAELAVAMSHTINYDSIHARAKQITDSGVSKEDLAAAVGIIRAVNAGVQLREALIMHEALGTPYTDTLDTKAMLDKAHQHPGLSEREKQIIGLAVSLTRNCDFCVEGREGELCKLADTPKEDVDDLRQLAAITRLKIDRSAEAAMRGSSKAARTF